VLKSAFDLVRRAATRWADDRCDRLSAALSYYALFSLFPLALLALTTLGFFLGDDSATRSRIVGALVVTGSPELRALLDQALEGMQQHRTARGVGAVVGLATLLFGASAVFSELQNSLDVVWHVPPQQSGIRATVVALVTGRARAFVLVIAAALLLLASLVASTVLAAVGESGKAAVPISPVWDVFELLASAVFVAPVLALVYRVLPHARVSWSDAFWGGIVAAILLALLKKVLAFYLAHLGSYAAYGVAGAILGLLTWIDASAMVLYFGAEIARAHCEDRQRASPADREAISRPPPPLQPARSR
jgi:membrane protein